MNMPIKEDDDTIVVASDEGTIFELHQGDVLQEFASEDRELLVEQLSEYGRSLAEQVEGLGPVQPELARGAAAAGASVSRALLAEVARNSNLFEELPAERRATVSRAMEQIATLLGTTAHTRDIPSRQLADEAQAAVDAFTVLVRGDARQLQSVIDALVPVGAESEDVDAEQAEARGRLRLQALYRKLLRESFTVRELERDWGLKRQRLKQFRDDDRLFAIDVPHHKGLVYPRWQFDRDMRPRAVLPALIAAAKQAQLDAIGFHQIMTNPEAGGGTQPDRLLDEGRDEVVLDILRAAGR